MAPSEAFLGSPTCAPDARIATVATTASNKMTALTMNAPPTPRGAMSTPASAGPTNSVPWLSAPNHVIAFMMWPRGTVRGR